MRAEVNAPAPPPAAPLQLVFAGECLPGHDPGAVREAVALALKLDDARAARLFSGRRVVLRSAVDEATALRYVSRFRQLGAALQVEPAAAAPSPARAPTPAPAPTSVRPPTRAASAAAPAPATLAWRPPWRSVALGVGAVAVGAMAWLLGLSVLDTLREGPPPAPVEAVAPVVGTPARAEVDARPPGPAPVPAAGGATSGAGVPDAELPEDMGEAARIDYRQHYLPAAGHKAFALGGSGYDWHVGAASEDEAREAALEFCMRQQTAGGASCRVIDVDGELTE